MLLPQEALCVLGLIKLLATTPPPRLEKGKAILSNKEFIFFVLHQTFYEHLPSKVHLPHLNECHPKILGIGDGKVPWEQNRLPV